MLTCRWWPSWVTAQLIFTSLPHTSSSSWTPIVVKNVTELGPQLSPGVTNVSRDGGYSSLINGKIVWTFDDTECFDHDGDQLSFISNTASYSDQPNKNILLVADFGVVEVGKDKNGEPKRAILADKTVGTGGWIPFQPDELDFNNKGKGKQRVAIWPGTSPTSVNPALAFMFAPLVYVDSKPKDPAKQYSNRGMTLISITAPKTGPLATRQGDLIIPGKEVPFGGFSTLLGYKSAKHDSDPGDRDIYAFGVADHGLQLARAAINDIRDWSKYTFYDPEDHGFSSSPPDPHTSDPKKIYLPGSYSSGSIFYSPYFSTFVMMYFNNVADSTFYMRYLALDRPLKADKTWLTGGRNGKGIDPEDVEALVRYSWSAEQKLWTSPTKQGGFNYAGNAHPEFFNRQYFAPTLYPELLPRAKRVNDWYGASLISEAKAGGDGKNLLLSWTAQLQSGLNNGIYQVQLALLEFGDIPPNPEASGTTGPNAGPSATASGSASSSKHGHGPVKTAINMIEKGSGHSLLGDRKVGWRSQSGTFGLAVWLIGLLGVGALRV